MEKPMLRADRLGERFEKGDHIVLGHLFDPGDSFHIDRRLLPNTGRGPARNLSGSLECCAGSQFDCKPDLVLTFQFPDGLHLGTGIAVDHLVTPLTPYPSPLTRLSVFLPAEAQSPTPYPKCHSRTSMHRHPRNSSPTLSLHSLSPWPARRPSTAVHTCRLSGCCGPQSAYD